MNLLRTGLYAPDLPKRRRPSKHEKYPKHTTAEVDEYNSRQLIRCVESRRRWSDKESEYPGPPGMRYSTTTSMVEAAQRILTPIELAAYMAKEQGTQEHQNQLVGRLEEIILNESRAKKWRYYHKSDQADPIRLLAGIVVEEWLNPAKYWRLRDDENGTPTPRPIVSSFARVMCCNRATWYTKWNERFLLFQGYPQDWYEIGKDRMGVT